eukprot:GILJ01010940.1.p1 GENE.GILJ01010940.1~~GILJ01010940.1.p1  ORF type:complete len:107 (+),score=3.40 GILJ01010940.1:469-789(+)
MKCAQSQTKTVHYAPFVCQYVTGCVLQVLADARGLIVIYRFVSYSAFVNEVGSFDLISRICCPFDLAEACMLLESRSLYVPKEMLLIPCIHGSFDGAENVMASRGR